MRLLPAILLPFVLFICLSTGPVQARSLVDMRGVAVELPDKIERIATISDGFVEEILTHLGQVEKVVALGSWGPKLRSDYSFSHADGSVLRLTGSSPMRTINPFLDEQSCFSSPMGDILDFEALAKAAPDVLILRVGDCTIRAGDKERVAKTIDTVNSLGIPLVVLYAPDSARSAGLESLREEAVIIGAVFGQEEKALAFADGLSAVELLIRERTSGVPEAQKPRVLFIGLSGDVRKKGGAGQVWGLDTPESYIIEEVVGAKNAFRGKGSGVPLSAEQIYALDPDVIILPTSRGYHPPMELLEAPYFENLRELRAIREKRVYSMPYSPKNCARRAEYPLDMLITAKAAYPEKFADFDLYDYSLNFYMRAYGLTAKKAREVRSFQLLDWMKEAGF